MKLLCYESVQGKDLNSSIVGVLPSKENRTHFRHKKMHFEINIYIVSSPFNLSNVPSYQNYDNKNNILETVSKCPHMLRSDHSELRNSIVMHV